MRSPILIAALLLSLGMSQTAKAEAVSAVFIGAAVITAAVGGTVLYDEFTPKSQHCYWPTPRQRVCKIVKDTELERRISAEADRRSQCPAAHIAISAATFADTR